MPKSALDEMLERLHSLEAELEQELDSLLQQKRQQFRYSFEKGKVRFERGIKSLQKKQRQGIWSYLLSARLAHVLSAPVIYSVILPLLFLDLAVTLYQHVCFRIYGIPRVIRSQYIIIDRHQLGYLNGIEKFNCIYCGYSNGLVEYIREVTARTEQYWCPIKHARRSPDPHRLSEKFVDYGDAEHYRERLQSLRKSIQKIHNDLGGC